jgi:hypothetical protein
MSFPLMPAPSVQFAAPVLSFTASFNTSNNYTTTTWTAVAIGAAATNRYVIVSLHTDPGTVTPTAVSVGGINATLLQAKDGIGLFIALVPTGTTANITITFSGLSARHAIGVWSVTGLTRGTPAGVKAAGTGLAASCSLVVPQGAAVVAAVSHAGGTGVAWTGGVTEQFDGANGNALRMSGAHVAGLAASTLTPTATAPASAAWRIAAIVLR